MDADGTAAVSSVAVLFSQKRIKMKIFYKPADILAGIMGLIRGRDS